LVTGFDFSEFAINTAKNKCDGLSIKPPEFIVGDINSYTTDEKYDLIIMSEVLEHIEEDARILQKYRNFLKNDGYVLISVPYDPSYWSVEDEQSGHVRRYDNRMIDDLFIEANLQINKRVWIGFPTIKLMWMVKRKILRFFNFINNPKRGTTKSKIIRLFSGVLVWVDSHFSFVNQGVGIIVVAKK
jgi:SAM-dependent methyltransferase